MSPQPFRAWNAYVDPEVPVLRRMFAKRVRAYKAMGYGVEADSDTLSIGGS